MQVCSVNEKILAPSFLDEQQFCNAEASSQTSFMLTSKYSMYYLITSYLKPFISIEFLLDHTNVQSQVSPSKFVDTSVSGRKVVKGFSHSEHVIP